MRVDTSMTQYESVTITKRLIRESKSGKEIADAIIAHFKTYGPTKRAPSKLEEALSSSLDLLNAPLLKSN